MSPDISERSDADAPGRRRRSPPAGAPRRGRVVVPSLAAGVLLTLTLPPVGLWVCGPLGAAVLWWRLRGLRARTRLLAGLCCGLGLYVPGLFWSLHFNVYGGITLMVAESLALALGALLSPPGRGRTAALPGVMVLTEALRSSWPFGGLPIGSVALGQIGGPAGGAARLGGPLLLVGLVWAAGSGLGAVAVGVAGRRSRPDGSVARGAVAAGAVALGAVIAVAAVGAVAADGGPAVSTLRVAAVQGGGLRGYSKEQVDPATVYHAQLAATDEIRSFDDGRPPSLVLWPEDVVSLDRLLQDDPAKGQLAAVARRLQATLVVGVTETVSSAQYRNEAVAFAPDGRIVGRYEKVHRVPFGEYVPDRGFFSHLANLSAVPLDAIPGKGDGVLDTPAGKLGTMVSYEVFFSDRGRIPTRAGAELLIVPTNTSSYTSSQIPSQEIAASRLQAVSEGRDLVQAAPTGFSAVITNRGVVRVRTDLSRRQVLVADVGLRTGRTLYERLGDPWVLALAAVGAVAGWVLAAPWRRRDRPRPVG